MNDPNQAALEAIAKALIADGYARSDGRSDVTGVLGMFAKMRADAERYRTRPSTTSGRDTATAFLKATVEDENRLMSDRMGAAALLIQDRGQK